MTTSLTRALARTAAAAAVVVAAIAARPSDAAAQAANANAYRHVPKDTVAQNVYQGWKQYELNCARCHGEYAVGTSFAPALVVSLKEGGTVPTKESFMTTVCAGRKEKGMPAWCELGLEMNKIDDMYAYIKARADGKVGAGRPAVKPEG